jgi:uncharacterized lipoprotein YmbA
MNATSDRHLRTRPWLPALLVSVFSACSSVPQRFYTLTAPPGTSAPPASVDQHSSGAPLLIEVLPVVVPAQADVPQIVVRLGSDEVKPVETRRWAAPLADEIRSALSEDLARTLNARDVRGLSTAAIPTYRIAVRITRFDSSLGAYAAIDASWSVTATTRDTNGLTCSISTREPVVPGYEALVAGHQRALGTVAQKIAASILALRDGHPASDCIATPLP